MILSEDVPWLYANEMSFMFCYNYKIYEVLQLFYFSHLVTPDDLEWPLMIFDLSNP